MKRLFAVFLKEGCHVPQIAQLAKSTYAKRASVPGAIIATIDAKELNVFAQNRDGKTVCTIEEEDDWITVRSTTMRDVAFRFPACNVRHVVDMPDPKQAAPQPAAPRGK